MLNKPVALLSLAAAVMVGCSEAPPQQSESSPPPTTVEREESGGEPAVQVGRPFAPGRSGLLSPTTDEAVPDRFDVTSGNLRQLPERVISVGSRRIVTDSSGTLAVYGGGGELLWEAATSFEEPLVYGELVILATEGGLEARELDDGGRRWSIAGEASTVAILLREETIYHVTEEEVTAVAVSSGDLLERREPSSPVGEAILGEDRLYLRTLEGVGAYGLDGRTLWKYEAPGARRITVESSGASERLLLEAGEAALLLSPQGSLLWSSPLPERPYRPVLAGGECYLAYPSGRLAVYALDGGELRGATGVATALPGRPVYWRGTLWVPDEGGGLLLVTPDGEVLGRLPLGSAGAVLLYGDPRFLGAVSLSGESREISPAERGDLEVEYSESGRVTEFSLPSLRPGAGPVMVTMREEPISLTVEQETDGIYRFELPLHSSYEAIIDLIGEDGATLASNLDKIELADFLRVRLEADDRYRLELRPAAEELTGAPAAVSLNLVRRE